MYICASTILIWFMGDKPVQRYMTLQQNEVLCIKRQASPFTTWRTSVKKPFLHFSCTTFVVTFPLSKSDLIPPIPTFYSPSVIKVKHSEGSESLFLVAITIKIPFSLLLLQQAWHRQDIFTRHT